MAIEIRVPTLGESVSEATIGKWFKKAGDAVKADEPILELETDKVTLEVNAPAAGVLAEIIAKDGETVEPGGLLGQITEGGAAADQRRLGEEDRGQAGQGTRQGRGRRAQAGRRCQGRPRRLPRVRRHGRQRRGRSERPQPDAAGPGRRETRRRSRHQGRGGRGHRPTRPADQGRRAGLHAKLTREPADRDARTRRQADPGSARPDPRAVRALGRRSRGAGQDDQAPADHRPAPEGRAVHRGHADDLQRGRHDRGHGAADQVQGAVREEARRQARLHELLREGLRSGAQGRAGRQRRDRRHRSHLQELLSPRHRRRHRQGSRRAGGARL